MANRRAHQVVGTGVGIAWATYCARGQEDDNQALEVFGGAVAGFIGGRMPDILDRPTHPGHRDVAHAVAPVGTIASWYFVNLDGWQESLRAAACEYGGIMEVLFRVAAGAVAGFGVGYLSHLALDATTPRGLPLLHS